MLESLPAQENDTLLKWLRLNIKPLVRAFQSHWSNVGLVFGMDGPDKLFNFNEANEIVYFGRAKDRSEQLKLTYGTWMGVGVFVGPAAASTPASSFKATVNAKCR